MNYQFEIGLVIVIIGFFGLYGNSRPMLLIYVAILFTSTIVVCSIAILIALPGIILFVIGSYLLRITKIINDKTTNKKILKI